MAAKHMAQKGTTPTSEQYERSIEHKQKNSSQTESAPRQTSEQAAPGKAKRSSSKHQGHPARIALIVIVIALVALLAVYAAVPTARATVHGWLQPQAAQEATDDDAATSTEADSGSEDAATTAEDVETSDASNAQADDDQDAGSSDDSASQEESEPEPVDDDSPYDAAAAASTYTTSAGISVTAAPGFESTTTATALDTALTNLTSQGYTVSFAMEDLTTGKGVWYNTDAMMYPASSIKAAYCTWILESTGGNVSSSTSATIENCLVNSSNDAFHTLINAYGLPTYASWLAQFAPETSPKARTYFYPEISATGFANLWKEIYRYGNSGEGGSSLLTQCLAASNHSAMGGLLRDKYTVWSKPGWYPADGSGLQATNDTGIVFSDCGDYAYVVLTNVPDDFSSVFPLIDALNATHGKICGGHSALYVNANTSVSGSEG